MRKDWPKHDYSVRNVKTFRGMEGEGFNAALYRDGRRIALGIDDASGGPIRIEWTDPETRDREEKCLVDFLKTLPKERLDEREYEVTPDTFLAALVEEAETEKRLRRLFQRETLFRLKEDRTDDDRWRVLKTPFSSAVKAQLVNTYGDRLAHILNEDYPHLNPAARE